MLRERLKLLELKNIILWWPNIRPSVKVNSVPQYHFWAARNPKENINVYIDMIVIDNIFEISFVAFLISWEITKITELWTYPRDESAATVNFLTSTLQMLHGIGIHWHIHVYVYVIYSTIKTCMHVDIIISSNYIIKSVALNNRRRDIYRSLS